MSRWSDSAEWLPGRFRHPSLRLAGALISAALRGREHRGLRMLVIRPMQHPLEPWLIGTASAGLWSAAALAAAERSGLIDFPASLLLLPLAVMTGLVAVSLFIVLGEILNQITFARLTATDHQPLVRETIQRIVHAAVAFWTAASGTIWSVAGIIWMTGLVIDLVAAVFTRLLRGKLDRLDRRLGGPASERPF